MRLVVLIENSPGVSGVVSEHGLSLYVETPKHRLLMDTGATGAFADNAELLGIDLSKVDTVILSHGHYDHAGGLVRFAELNTNAPVLMREGALGDHYHGERYIGLSPEAKKLPSLRPVYGDGETRLDEELSIFAGVTGNRFSPVGNVGLTVRQQGMDIPDSFDHEQYLVITEGKRRYLLSGCAHKGILNILDRFRELYGGVPDCVISGFHMRKSSAFDDLDISVIMDVATELSKLRTVYYTGHCTGDAAFQIMHRVLGDRLHQLHSGMELVL